MRGGRWIATIAGLVAVGLAASAQAKCAYNAGAATIDVPGSPFAAEATADGCWLFASLMDVTPGAGGGVAVLKTRAAPSGWRGSRRSVANPAACG